MGLLATWGQYSTYVDSNGKYRVIWQQPDGSIVMHKFDSVPTNPFMERFFDKMVAGVEREVGFEDGDETLIRDAVAYIRTHPALTLTQWNTYLNAKQWYEKEIIKWFIWKLAIGLAAHYGLILSNYTETEVLAKVRNWICNTDLNVVKRVCFGYLISM